MQLYQELRYSTPVPCPYLPGKTLTQAFFFAGELDENELDLLLEAGWRRFGYLFFRPVCVNCRKCIPIRITVNDFLPSKSQRRLLRKNNNTSIVFMLLEYFEELFRVSKNQIIWGCNYFIGHINAVGRIVFDKTDGGRAGLNFSDCDLASNSIHKNIKVYRYKWMGIMGLSKEPNRIHPSQKPIQLYKWLLKNYAKPNFKIIDTHAGSCSSVIAFMDYGCEWIAFEINRDYYEAASKRIENHRLQLKLWNK